MADPRHDGPAKHSNEFRIVDWNRAARAVTSAHGTGQAVADPRQAGEAFAKYAVTAYDQAAGTVIAGSTTGQGAFAVADPRPGMKRSKGDPFIGGGHYGVVRYSDSSWAVSASACHDNGPWCIADPRSTESVPANLSTGTVLRTSGTLPEHAHPQNVPVMPAANDKLVARIQSLDGTWHRPFTTLELAALQSFIDPEEYFSAMGPASRGEQFVLDGASDQRWREAIGNAVPRKAARAIGTVMGQTILLARNGETFMLGSTPIWVQPMVTAISVAQGGAA